VHGIRFLRPLVKPDRAIKSVPIGQGDTGEGERSRPVRESFRRRGPAKEAEGAAGVQFVVVGGKSGHFNDGWAATSEVLTNFATGLGVAKLVRVSSLAQATASEVLTNFATGVRSIIIPLQQPFPSGLDEAEDAVIEQFDVPLASLPLLPLMPPVTAAFPGSGRGDDDTRDTG
jgi:hypothetical protein